MSTPSRRSADWDLAQVLAESTRRRLFNAVRAAGTPVTRDEMADATGINRRLVAFHLDRLVAAGVLRVDYARPAGRSGGPGAGRPAKRYCPTPMQLDLSVPPRRYDMAARVLAAGIVANPTDAVSGALTAARDIGEAFGAERELKAGLSRQSRTDSLCGALTEIGYEPATEDCRVRLGNCPFRSIADLAPELVCAVNRELIDGLVDGMRAQPAEVELRPDTPPACCVTITVS